MNKKCLSSSYQPPLSLGRTRPEWYIGPKLGARIQAALTHTHNIRWRTHTISVWTPNSILSSHTVSERTILIGVTGPSDRRTSNTTVLKVQYAFDMFRFLEPCNSPYFTQFAAFFIDLRAE